MLRLCTVCRNYVPAHQYNAHRATHGTRNGSTSQWRRIRAQILARDGHVCASCGSTRQLEVHHRDENHRNNHASNLVTLCFDCHPRN